MTLLACDTLTVSPVAGAFIQQPSQSYWNLNVAKSGQVLGFKPGRTTVFNAREHLFWIGGTADFLPTGINLKTGKPLRPALDFRSK